MDEGGAWRIRRGARTRERKTEYEGTKAMLVIIYMFAYKKQNCDIFSDQNGKFGAYKLLRSYMAPWCVSHRGVK